MRSHPTVAVGQIWQDNDPRRMRLVKVHFVPDNELAMVTVVNTYPKTGKVQLVARKRFLDTTHKGLTRVR